MFWKKDVLINSCSESCQGKFSVKILENIFEEVCFSKVTQSHSLKFLARKESIEKHNFHKFLYWVKTSVNATESCRLSACNFTKNELFHRYFSRILTANFRIPIFRNTFQVAAFAEAYSGPCQTSKMELFCEYN